MAEKHDRLIRFLLPEARARGVIIRGKHIFAEAADVHGLVDEPKLMFGQTLLASLMLLSISKGGVRQVLQLDATQSNTAIKRMQAETRSGAVRGYVQWSDAAVHQRQEHQGIAAWMGENMLLSTVRDMGVGQPYVSTIQHNSEWLADYVLHYLKQSVQVHADLILQDDLAIMIEAMPGSDDDYWFKAVESLAKISNASITNDAPETILNAFKHLGCQIVGEDLYAYACSCSDESMAVAMTSIPDEDLLDLADEAGDVTLSCQYCKRISKINIATQRS